MSGLTIDALDVQTGWVALAGTLVGDVDTPSTLRSAYDWDEQYWPTKDEAVAAGYELADDTDDFNLGYVDHGRLAWFGWMDEMHPTEGYADVAQQFGWSS